MPVKKPGTIYKTNNEETVPVTATFKQCVHVPMCESR